MSTFDVARMFANCPTPTRKKIFGYDNAADSARLKNGLQKLGYDSFRPGQEDVVKAVLSGRDVMFLFPTGGGKSLCYQLPIMILPPPQVAIVISPLIALMQDQLKNANKLGIATRVLNSTLKAQEQKLLLAELQYGGSSSSNSKISNDDEFDDFDDDLIVEPAKKQTFRLLYVTPEQTNTQQFKTACAAAVAENRVAYVAVDEAHCISSWGHDFRPAYRNLGSMRKLCPGVPFMACTATATNQVQEEFYRDDGFEPVYVS